jgi:hypothetical protein
MRIMKINTKEKLEILTEFAFIFAPLFPLLRTHTKEKYVNKTKVKIAG